MERGVVHTASVSVIGWAIVRVCLYMSVCVLTLLPATPLPVSSVARSLMCLATGTQSS